MNTTQLEELGLLIGAVGGLVIAIGAAMMVIAIRSYAGATEVHHRREKWLQLLGAILISAGFVVGLVSVLSR
jgi:uncharacterized membrane protein HdeD (DUF308 family)